MNSLPLEVIEYIAKIDNKTWYLLVQVYKFLYGKTFDSNYIDELKRKFLLCSTLTPNVNYNKNIIYKYNKLFHSFDNSQKYEIVYYLPNGNLHTFADPCKLCCQNGIDILHIWFKDNKIHRDNDLPAVIHHRIGKEDIWNVKITMDDEPIFKDILKYFPKYFVFNEINMWFKNGLPHRDNDSPSIIKPNWKEWRQNGLLHRDNDMPALVIYGIETWYNKGTFIK